MIYRIVLVENINILFKNVAREFQVLEKYGFSESQVVHFHNAMVLMFAKIAGIGAFLGSPIRT